MRRQRLLFLVLKTISRWEALRRVPKWAGCLGSNGSILTPLLTVMVVASKLLAFRWLVSMLVALSSLISKLSASG